MVRNSSQNGSAYTVIIIGLVLALIGSLGFIFWQNYSKDKTQVETSTVDDTNIEKVANENAGTKSEYVTLDEWGVKFEVPTETSEVKFYKFSDIDAYDFTTARVEALGGNCVEANGSSATRLGALGRSSTKLEEPGNTIVNNNQPIDGYYYYYSGPQSTCSDSGLDVQNEDRQMLYEMLSKPISVETN